jgi:hypothetical protein
LIEGLVTTELAAPDVPADVSTEEAPADTGWTEDEVTSANCLKAPMSSC